MPSVSLRVAVLASGSGTNFQALIDRFDGSTEVSLVALATDNPEAGALARAERAGIPSRVFARADYEERAGRDAAMADWLQSLEVELVVLAGYMQLLDAGFLDRFPGRVINVHPALLPAFPGLDAIGQAWRHGVKVTGVTVHFVDAGMDTGPIIAQRSTELTYTRSIDRLEADIHRIEHQLLPEVVSLIAAGRIRMDAENPRLVHIDE